MAPGDAVESHLASPVYSLLDKQQHLFHQGVRVGVVLISAVHHGTLGSDVEAMHVLLGNEVVFGEGDVSGAVDDMGDSGLFHVGFVVEAGETAEKDVGAYFGEVPVVGFVVKLGGEPVQHGLLGLHGYNLY